MHELIIIGSGAAGWTAAIYAARAGIKPLVIVGPQYGGQMTVAGEIENFPGFSEPIKGDDLMMTMAEQAQSYGAEAVFDTVASVDFTQQPLKVVGELSEYRARCVIIATGASARWLNIPGEEELKGSGVSACATCDGYFFRDQEVAVVGGGNTAIEEALHLSSLCKTVHLIHRRDGLKGERILIDRLLAKENVVFHWCSEITEIVSESGNSRKLQHLVVYDKNSHAQSKLYVAGLFVAIGHDAATGPFRGAVSLDENGYILVNPGGVNTSVDGVFAAGDVADPVYRQAVTAAGMGCMAALSAEKWINKENTL